MRVVDAQGYHLRWIDVSGLDKKTAVFKALRLGHAEEDKKTGPQGEGRLGRFGLSAQTSS